MTATLTSSQPPPAARGELDPGRPYPVATVLQRIRESARTGFAQGAHELTFQALGTRCRVSYSMAPAGAAAVAAAVLQWVAAFEAKYSRFLPDSLVSRINAAAGREWVALDAEAGRIFALCQELHFLTHGILDPTALPVIRAWDWKTGRIPTDAEIATALDLVGWRKVQRAPGKIFLPRPGMALDLGGMGKEYAVDQVVLLVRQAGASAVLVDFGADVRVAGPPPDGRPAWHIGLEDPAQPGRGWCGLALNDAAVATSGDYVRKFEANGRRYGHIIDPRTGQPVAHGGLAVSVIAPSCTQAGMLSTAAFVLGGEAGRQLLEAAPGAEGILLYPTTKLSTSHFHEHVVP